MAEERGTEDSYTVVGVIDDGVALNQAIQELHDLGVHPDALTVILKRKDLNAPEPFPEGTRYIIVPDDRRGLEVPIGFAIAFIIIGFLFAITTPAIGLPVFLVFLSLASILFAGVFSRVGVEPILTAMEAPRDEASSWNEQFEMGKVLIFANTTDRGILRPLREILQRNNATYYLVNKRLEPRAIHQATLNRAGGRSGQEQNAKQQGTRGT